MHSMTQLKTKKNKTPGMVKVHIVVVGIKFN